MASKSGKKAARPETKMIKNLCEAFRLEKCVAVVPIAKPEIVCDKMSTSQFRSEKYILNLSFII